MALQFRCIANRRENQNGHYNFPNNSKIFIQLQPLGFLRGAYFYIHFRVAFRVA